MTSIKLTLQPLTAQAFADFGDVIELSKNNKIIPINYGLTERHHNLANIDVSDYGGKAIVSLFSSQPISLPFQIKVMERHPLGSQTFIPLQDPQQGESYLVIVATAGKFNQHNLHAFCAQANQGVNYHKGTWHHYCLALNTATTFAVIDRRGQGNNCDEISIDDDINICVSF